MEELNHELLAIVSTGKESRVYCQEKNCTKTVYKKIHIVRFKGDILALGSTCYKKLFYGQKTRKAFYTGEDRKLTDNERELLVSNTAELINQFKAEYENQKKAKAELYSQKIDNALLGFRPENLRSERVVKRSIASAEKKGGMPLKNRSGTKRQVKCYYCKKPMMTDLDRVPAVGFKCEVCSKNRVPAPRSSRGY